jgi:hypothetical protein
MSPRSLKLDPLSPLPEPLYIYKSPLFLLRTKSPNIISVVLILVKPLALLIVV